MCSNMRMQLPRKKLPVGKIRSYIDRDKNGAINNIYIFDNYVSIEDAELYIKGYKMKAAMSL